MGPIVLDGKALASDMEDDLRRRVEKLAAAAGSEAAAGGEAASDGADAAAGGKAGKVPVLATILVGSDPSSKIYVTMKGNACRRIGLGTRKVELPEDTTTEALLSVIDGLNSDESIFGILLQHPVPRQIDERACFDRIARWKDVDGVTASGFGAMALGEEAFVSATPGGIMKLLSRYGIPLEGRRAVVVGRSAILGKPVAMLLLNQNATVTICHSKTADLERIVGEADIVVAAVGKPNFVKASWIKEGAVLVDAGYHPGGVGDVEKEAYAKTSAYTPVPGGVGPMTIATLMCQTVESAEKFYYARAARPESTR
jgi:methylenetetrahydrofolate dehydrogenase (NADP+)/methenyltetrahydrofolate cyclohydrolase